MAKTNILIVDDEQDIRESLRDILEDEGHKIYLAENAEEARSIKDKEAIELILLDIWMPDCDGITLLKEWATNNKINCPVIMMSGHGTIDTAIEATKIGAYDFLEKPISLQKLLNTINSALKKEIHVTKIDQTFLNTSQANWIIQFRQKIIDLKTSNLIYLEGSDGNFLNICINRLVGTNYLLIDINAVIKDNFIEKAAQKGCNAILFKNYSQFEKLKKENISKFLKENIFKKIKIIFIDDNIASIIPSEVPKENILYMPDFSNEQDLIPDFSLSILQFYLSMNKHLGYKEFEISALNSLRVCGIISNIDLLDDIVFNLIKVTEGQKISSEDVINYLQNLRSKENQKTYEKGSTSNINEDIFHKTLREARDDFEKLYFKFHMQKKLSVSELAKKSGVERTHLYRKLKSLGIKSR
ncbi:MAG: two-component system nitrogen regulation response regulator NtrX [Methylophilaceae bacterium]|jgi:two-component system nitrogen regulation response regulator NtrX